jgi:arsenate reductase
MMHGWLKTFGGKEVEVRSAGIETHGVNPTAIKVMAEADVDISGHTSNHIDEYMSEQFDSIITVCDHAKESCPVFPSTAEQMHHNFTDPAKATGTEEQVLNEFRRVRDEIKDFAKDFLSVKIK